VGEVFALLTALLFAIGVILFKKSVGVIPPFALNFFKNSLALALLIPSAIVLGPVAAFHMPAVDVVRILFSGVMGVGISDTLFFMTLNRLGASRTALIDCLYSPMVILFSLILLDEALPAVTVAGGVLIVGSVVLSSQRQFGIPIAGRQFWTGCALGAGAMATVAFAIVLVKPVLGAYPLIWISTVRMAGGLLALLLVLPFHSDRGSVAKAFRPQTAWKWMAGGTFFGTYLSLVTWLAGFKYSLAGTAAVLNQTSTVFIVVFAAIFLKEPMTRTKLLAVAVAFAGAAIILY
jgi:drug/metabolite transporter (DMT)-like permease